MNLFKLVGSIFVDNSAANESISKTDEKASGLGNTLSKGIKTVAAWGTAIVSAAVVAGTAIYSSATSAAAAADNIDKMSQKIGISREAYQELDFICSQSGMSVDTLQTGVKSLTAAMDGARDGTASNVEQFERLGVAVTNADGSFRSQEDVLFDTLMSLQGISDQTEKARLATELFGKSGTELMPLLNGEAGSIEEMKQQAHDLGLVLNDELIDNGVNLTDSLDQTKRAFQSIAVNLGGSFMPIITEVSEYIQTLLPDIQDGIERISPIITNLSNGLIPNLMSLVEVIFPLLLSFLETVIIPILNEVGGKLLPVIVDVLNMLIPVAIQIISAVLPKILDILLPILDLLDPIISLFEPILNLIVALIDPLMMLIDAVLPPLVSMLLDVLSGDALPFLQETIQWLCDFLIEYVIPLIQSLIEVIIIPAVQGLSAFLSTTLSGNIQLIRGVVSVITGIVQAVLSLIEGDFGRAKESVLKILRGLKDIALGLIRSAGSVAVAVIDNNKEKIMNIINAAKDWIVEKLNFAKEKAISIFSNMGDKIHEKVSSMTEKVKGLIEKLKGMFDFEFKIPNIKAPHFKMSPTGWKIQDILKGDIPDIDIEWYAKGAVMTQPTAFGIRGDKILAGGEAGPEAILPISTLKDYIREANIETDKSVVVILQLILEELKRLNDEIYEKIIDAILNGVKIEWNDRELGRLVRKFA